jgi:hypothetical protein
MGAQQHRQQRRKRLLFKIELPMTLDSVDVDVALMLTRTPLSDGFTEVLCTGYVSRGRAPSFAPGAPAYPQPPVSGDFGNVILHNPNDLQGPFNGRLAQDQFLAVILKAWAPVDGTASGTARHVTSTPALELQTGDYLVFHMDHAGVGGDVEMQVVLGYQTR